MAKFNLQPNMVFPSTKMDSVNKLISEGSLTRLINKLIDTDSYIIPPNSAVMNNYVNTDVGTMLEITDIADDEMEFLLHGYYFNMGRIRQLVNNAENIANSDINQNELNGNLFITASIFIDNDAKNNYKFPELFGEELNKQTNKQQVSNEAIKDPSKLPNIKDFPELKDKPISSIDFSYIDADGNESYWGKGSYDALGAIQPPSQQFTEGTIYYFTIYYHDYSSLINLHVIDSKSNIEQKVDEATSPENITKVMPGDYDLYYLNLLYIDRTTDPEKHKVYVPLNNFSKFKHYSIQSIDGGIL